MAVAALDTDSGDGSTDASSSDRATWWKRIGYAAIAVALVAAAVTAAGGISDAADDVRRASAWWFLPALVAVTARFLILGGLLRRLRGSEPVPNVRLGIGVALVAFGLGALTPASPAEGFTLSAVELRRRNMAPRRAWLMLAASQWLQLWALGIVFALDRLAVVALGDVHHGHTVRVAAGSLALLAFCLAGVWLIRRPNVVHRAAAITRVLPGQRSKTARQRASQAREVYRDLIDILGDRRNRAAVLTLAALGWVADASVLWCALHAAHTHVSFTLAVLAYVVATAVSSVPLLPAGFGLVEVAVPQLLHHYHVAIAAGLAAVLLWRVISFALPALAGMLALATLRVRDRQADAT